MTVTSGSVGGRRKRAGAGRYLVGGLPDKNITEALERFLTRQHAALRQAERPAESSAAGPQAAEDPPEQGRATLERRDRRRARYDAVVALRAQG